MALGGGERGLLLDVDLLALSQGSRPRVGAHREIVLLSVRFYRVVT